MNLPTIQIDREAFDQQFAENDVTQPLIKINQNEVIAERRENSFKQKFGKKLLSNLMLFGGGWLLFAGSSTLCHILIREHDFSSNPFTLRAFAYSVIGLVLVTLSIEKTKKLSDWLLLTIFPLTGCLFTLLTMLLPREWRTNNFFYVLHFSFYLLVLFIFYYVKDNFVTKTNFDTIDN